MIIELDIAAQGEKLNVEALVIEGEAMASWFVF